MNCKDLDIVITKHCAYCIESNYTSDECYAQYICSNIDAAIKSNKSIKKYLIEFIEALFNPDYYNTWGLLILRSVLATQYPMHLHILDKILILQ